MPSRKLLRDKKKAEIRLPVDAPTLNMGSTYDSPPEYYYDIEFTCQDCQSVEIWKAARQNGGTRKLARTFSPRRFAVEPVVTKNAIVKLRRDEFILRESCEKAKASPDEVFLLPATT